MIERKEKKFNKNLGENKSRGHNDKKSFISSVTSDKEKTAAETASSILEELGVKKTSTKKKNNKNFLNTSIKDKKSINQNNRLDERQISVLKDLKKEKFNTITQNTQINANQKIGIDTKEYKNKTQSRAKSGLPPSSKSVVFGIHEKFIFFIFFILIGFSCLAYIGGYIKFDLMVFRKIFNGDSHQLEFLEDFRARQVENGYNRIPLFVVEGTIRNSFYDSDSIEKIRIKAYAFDHEQRLIGSHFTYTGVILSDEQLETYSPIRIKTLRQTGDLSVLNNDVSDEFQSDKLEKISIKKKDIPFQVIFFKDVSTIKTTSIEIISYVRNKDLLFLGSSNRD